MAAGFRWLERPDVYRGGLGFNSRSRYEENQAVTKSNIRSKATANSKLRKKR